MARITASRGDGPAKCLGDLPNVSGFAPIVPLMKSFPKNAKWKIEKWRSRCAWCVKRIPATRKKLSIPVALREEARREIRPGTVEPMLLYQAGKAVPMMPVEDDSQARNEGKHAFFQLCSQKCAKALQSALRKEMAA